VPLDLAVEIGDREGLGKFHAAIALDPPDDVVGRGIEVGPAAMTVEFEFLAMRGHRRHDGFRGSLSAFEGRCSQNAAYDHAGAEVAAARLLNIEPWKSATAIKVNPDSPQRPLRAEALRRGITVFVPTPRLRGGFKKPDPRRIPPDKIEEAASLSRGDRWSEEVALTDMPRLDAIVCGSVAVTRDGRRCGKGEGY